MEVKPVELSEETKRWLALFAEATEVGKKYINEVLGIPQTESEVLKPLQP